MKPALMGSVFDSCRVVEQTADRISVHPEAGTPLGGVLRKRIVPGFPYSIIYYRGLGRLHLPRCHRSPTSSSGLLARPVQPSLTIGLRRRFALLKLRRYATGSRLPRRPFTENELSDPRSKVKTIQVRVKPNARVSSLEESGNGIWLAQLKSLPIGGKANEELVALVAKRFRCRKSAVSIKSGAAGRMKLVRIDST
jgi:uncharacterized protein